MNVKFKQSQPLLPESKNTLALCFVLLTSFVFLLTITVLVNTVSLRALSQRKVTFVQLKDGTAARIAEQDEFYREPKTIQTFVSSWVNLTWAWSGKIPGTNDPDPGIKVKGSTKVPTTAWMGSLMMESEFGKASLVELAPLVPNTIYSGKTRSGVYISHIGEPREIKRGVWEIDVIATRVVLEQGIGESREQFNRTFTIKAVEIPKSPLQENANELEKTIHSLRAAGLEISRIVEFKP
ncbi:hypothetical protein [Microcoleus sp. D3_18a_C4]|uniref:hypothetical protein n=1 Tax=Microcoleus sp. D3_18a_C4 TaxID=3055332 RepID=UPI002FD6A50D